MNSRLKHVLIVDDQEEWREDLEVEFRGYSRGVDAFYEFDITAVETLRMAVDVMRISSKENVYFDVIIFDLKMEDFFGNVTDRAGLDAIEALRFSRKTLDELPVVIVYTGHCTFSSCVEAMQNGAWDYIDKLDRSGEARSAQSVVRSAVTRLRALAATDQLRAEVEAWYRTHGDEVRSQYLGELVAFSYDGEVGIVGHGTDVFALELTLADWRRNHRSEKPYILEVV
jgi:DNA-binding NtrC family response regulator